MSHDNYIHDLNNKLTILYSMLRLSKLGYNPPDDQIDAVTERIHEILTAFHAHLNNRTDENELLTTVNQEDFICFIESRVNKLRRIFPTIEFRSDPTQESWQNLTFAFNKDLLYQIMENAVENSCNASAKITDIKVFQQQNEIILELKDDGEGFHSPSRVSEYRILPKGTGTYIIRENMKKMNGKAIFSENSPRGVVLSLNFPLIHFS